MASKKPQFSARQRYSLLSSLFQPTKAIPALLYTNESSTRFCPRSSTAWPTTKAYRLIWRSSWSEKSTYSSSRKIARSSLLAYGAGREVSESPTVSTAGSVDPSRAREETLPAPGRSPDLPPRPWRWTSISYRMIAGMSYCNNSGR